MWFSPTIPSRCSGCKSRKWNEGAKPEKMIIEKPKPVEIPKAIERESLKVEPAQVVPRRFVSCPECGSIGGMHQRKCSKG